MRKFRDQLMAAYDEKVVGLLENTVRKVALGTQAELSRATPVDTGRARSNWFGSVNTPARGTTQFTGGLRPMNVERFSVVSDVIFITNNLPYIKPLNDGSSAQAPSGFVYNVVDKQIAKVRSIARSLAK